MKYTLDTVLDILDTRADAQLGNMISEDVENAIYVESETDPDIGRKPIHGFTWRDEKNNIIGMDKDPTLFYYVEFNDIYELADYDNVIITEVHYHYTAKFTGFKYEITKKEAKFFCDDAQHPSAGDRYSCIGQGFFAHLIRDDIHKWMDRVAKNVNKQA
jgi:hypothetical protein